MDEPSAQLHLDLRRTIQDTLATRRPLVHHLNATSTWLLQIPRPESAVKHGSRFYWNVLIDPNFSKVEEKGWREWVLRRKSKPKQPITSIAEVEELLRENEILASGLRLGSGRKSNLAVEEETRAVVSLVDAVVYSSESTIDEVTARTIHRDVPIFTPAAIADSLIRWTYFREVISLPSFGSGGDRDWRSTSVLPLPDWIGISMLPTVDETEDAQPVIAVVFNNRYRNHTSKLASTARSIDGKRKRHAPIQPNEDEEVGEMVFFAPSGIGGQDVSSAVYGDPPTITLALVQNYAPAGRGDASRQPKMSQAERLLRPRYLIATQKELEADGWFAKWLRQPTTFAFGDMATEEEMAHGKESVPRVDNAVAHPSDAKPHSLIAGESKLLL